MTTKTMMMRDCFYDGEKVIDLQTLQIAALLIITFLLVKEKTSMLPSALAACLHVYVTAD
jgi:hypothetical protein